MRILVTGTSGLVGAQVSKRGIGRGYEVFARQMASQFALDPTGIVRVKPQILKLKGTKPRDSSLNAGKAMKTLNAKPLKLREALQAFQKTRPTQDR
jgi:GDP-D-mannose dehydratase